MKESLRIWQRFAARPGAALDGMVGIASEHAIEGLIEVLERYRPRRILELGSGIGTLTYTILATARRLGLDREEGGFTFSPSSTTLFAWSSSTRTSRTSPRATLWLRTPPASRPEASDSISWWWMAAGTWGTISGCRMSPES